MTSRWAFALAIASACAGPARAPRRVEITSQQAHAGHVAVGRAIVLGDDPGARATHASLAAGRAWLALGEELLALSDFEAAYEAAQLGLAVIGDAYRTRTLKDDSGIELYRARDLARAGEHAEAARVAVSVLASRVTRYVRTHAGAVE